MIALLVAAHPGDPGDPAHWARTPASPRMCWPPASGVTTIPTAGNPCSLPPRTCMYRGDSHGSRRLAEELHQRWRRQLGADHPDALTATANYSYALTGLVDQKRARTLGHDTLRRAWRVLGP